VLRLPERIVRNGRGLVPVSTGPEQPGNAHIFAGFPQDFDQVDTMNWRLYIEGSFGLEAWCAWKQPAFVGRERL